jgi:tetratricopeptide (TPR) repeat protein
LLAETGNPDNVTKVLNEVIEKGEIHQNIYLALGKIYQRKNNHKKAVEAFEKILADDPDDYNTLHALAVSKEKSGDIDGAITDLKKAISLNKNARDEYEFLGRLYTKVNSGEDAMKAYISFFDNKGKNQTIALKVGTYLYKKNNLKDAKKYLDMVKGNASKTSTYLNMIGNLAFNDEEYENAINIFKLANTKKPPLPIRKDNFKKLAESYLKLDNNKAALIWFDRFAQINKAKDKDVSYLRAFLYEKSNPAKARIIYEANLKAFPDDHRNYLQMGLILSKNKKTHSRSVSLLSKAVEVVDTIPAIWLRMARIYGKLKKPDEELDAYKKFVALDSNNLDSNNIEANIRIGTLLLKKEEASEAVTYLKTANKADPESAKIILVLSDAYILASRLDEAFDLLDGSKEAHRDNIEIQRKFVDVLRLMGKDQELIIQLEQILDKERDNETLLLYAQLLNKTGQLEEAKNVSEDILATDPENIGALMILGSVYKKEKKYSEANDVYNEITIIDNQYVAAFYERGDLFLMQSKPLWAEKYFKKALSVNPNYALASLGLAKVALLHKNEKKYKEFVEMAHSLDPTNELIKKEYEKIK